MVILKIWDDPKCQYINSTTQYKGFGGMQRAPPAPPQGYPAYGGYPPQAPYGGAGSYDFYASAYPGADPYGQQFAGDPYGGAYGAPPQPHYGGHGGYDAYGQGGAAPVTYTLHVPDNVVPAILGRGGQVIKEMMEQSGANIKVSQKGDYVPGTNLRIVTIQGGQNQASFAHQLVSAKIPVS
mmetsp:Transcript_21200/g.33219  ORF Transcript_21200/g.33219 Transcript_21200/m.33219 type:complete len:181 (+) Transcript_21200:503-1045(+)|eukprot:CAMPEP_0184323390 /NCGR_PEP_ID=MMETSP1049-20130417/130064_1 /TAXON_ID=77928 /ORGANISM="Proteomonas sulcata, Strain CCMP704" /LENGTH=180 /DNA_ID=CAMNT_0026644875 /DNA_START=192 /DNA_END=734 /DNA_ORIENTATION=+